MHNIVKLLCFDTLSTFMSSIFSFACSFYILTLTGSGSLFGHYCDYRDAGIAFNWYVY